MFIFVYFFDKVILRINFIILFYFVFYFFNINREGFFLDSLYVFFKDGWFILIEVNLYVIYFKSFIL